MELEIQDRKLNLIWLRDNCRCDECFNWETHQRKNTGIPKNYKIISYDRDEKSIRIVWDDSHNSRYDLDSIFEQCSTDVDVVSPQLWTAKEIQDELPIIECVDDGLSVNDMKTLMTSLLRLGVAFVQNVNPTRESTEKIVTHIGPMMHTMYGPGMWDINTELFKEYKDSAYTNADLFCHTDNTYSIEAPGFIVFHCTQPAERGGDSFLVDGFKAAQLLKEHNPRYYESLKSTLVEWQYVTKDKHLTHTSQILRIREFDDRLEQIRFNIYDRSPRTPLTKDISLFYRSFDAFQKLLQRPDMQMRVSLRPGTVMMINNWRILHGRTSFQGKRSLHGCFVAMGALLSSVRKLGLLR